MSSNHSHPVSGGKAVAKVAGTIDTDLTAAIAAHEAKFHAPPPPPIGRPFPAPVMTQTIPLPTSITTGSAFNAWLAGKSGSIVEFPPNASYDLDAGFKLERLNNIILRLNGATLRVQGPGNQPNSSAFVLRECSHVSIEGPATVVGNNPDTTNIFVPGNENSHVLALSGWYGLGPSSYIEMAGVDASHVYGDLAYLEGQNVAPNAPSHHVWVHGNKGTYIGRNGVSLINVTDVLVEDNDLDKVGMDALDIEPNFAVEQIRRATFRRNRIGAYGYMTQFQGWLLNTWSPQSSPVSDITLDDNDVAGNPAGRFDGSPRALHANVSHSALSNIAVTNNRTTLPAKGPVLVFANVVGVTVKGNAQPLVSGVLASFSGCTGVVTT